MSRIITLAEFEQLYEEGMLSDVVVWIEKGKTVILAKNVKGMASTPDGYEVVKVQTSSVATL
jgi:hypothetical protein